MSLRRLAASLAACGCLVAACFSADGLTSDGEGGKKIVQCGEVECDRATSKCCGQYVNEGGPKQVWACVPSAEECPKHPDPFFAPVVVACSDTRTCGAGEICCWNYACGASLPTPKSATCSLPAGCTIGCDEGAGIEVPCRPSSAADCPSGTVCRPSAKGGFGNLGFCAP